jgi:hypothetical protein
MPSSELVHTASFFTKLEACGMSAFARAVVRKQGQKVGSCE